jgi:hypothetical protein
MATAGPFNVLQGVIAVHEVEALVGEIEGQRVSDSEVCDPSCVSIEVVLRVDAGHRCTELLSQYRGFDSGATTDDEQCLDAWMDGGDQTADSVRLPVLEFPCPGHAVPLLLVRTSTPNDAKIYED